MKKYQKPEIRKPTEKLWLRNTEALLGKETTAVILKAFAEIEAFATKSLTTHCK